jgi:TPP-dependent 2-oxoacid decarboxylase
MWAAQHYKFDKPNRWINSGGLGTMGFGFPAAMGVQFAHPEAFGFGHLGTRRKMGEVRTTELPHWGTAAKIVELYETI